MPGATDTSPASPASAADEPLPLILGDEDDAANAAALLGKDEEVIEEDQAEQETPDAEAEATAEEETPERDVDPIDKKLQQRQQTLANREKALIDGQKALLEATASLKDAIAEMKANPSAATRAAVEEAKTEQVDAAAEIEAMIGSPDYDAYKDSQKVIKALLADNKAIRSELNTLKTDTAEGKNARAEAQRHDAYWNQFAAKNPVIGRAKGEQLWKEAATQAKSEAKNLSDEGIPTTEFEAQKQIFARLVIAAKAGKKPEAAPRPAASGGRLGPTAGRAGNTPAKERTLDDQVRAGEFNLSASMR